MVKIGSKRLLCSLAISNRQLRKNRRLRQIIFTLLLVVFVIPTGFAGAPDANVIDVTVIKSGRDKWTFHVTVEHKDTGWEDYCNGWDVMTEDGVVFKNKAEDPFTRLLFHPHENEQPFTRSQTISIPRDIKTVIVRAHDIVDGFGGKEMLISLRE